MPGRLRIVLVHVVDAHREAKLKDAITLVEIGLAALHVALHDDCIEAKLRVVLGLDQLEQDVHFWLVLMQWCSVVISDDGLLSWLKLCVNVLFDAFVLLILNERSEGPGHVRLVLDGELEGDLAALNHVNSHKITADEHGHLW